ncbi:MAG: DUF4921 family protein [Winkia neuii]|uniref:DUF4921 domain-containing protein n=1 Tax=Winkia neuii TaxID=33007 RepID=A0A2I1IMG5_9ACTO|nr:DUF4921 family protein [Winkia neuii]OFJ68580.1 UTP--glucose-1-phosphate uridylyltransferase [Actinomyces sp. HMSC064C12]OFK00545.1 UTP--glucose-1-phosphate uridylyltransferase [Actinomyces sp. HMSC072A03]OFT56753.1 UTP--glucose-1-phosphate uridylyltransferase [Actinomyces sp. HMSC06A08]MDK8099765.1 DUF4921 family protein [Winkia neuii]MDU3135595.1 DUF4921 family protein [Winkia neuii]
MSSSKTESSPALVAMQDGTVKQKNMLTGTEVWTVPGRGHRPLTVPKPNPKPIDSANAGAHCAFCPGRYLETPPEKDRLVRRGERWVHEVGLSADQITREVADFRRIPNLFEIVSANYWALNHGHQASTAERERMAAYLASDSGYDHVMAVLKARLRAYGVPEEKIAGQRDDELLPQATGFFTGGHDVIVARRHFVDGASDDSQLASSGTLTPEEHAAYIQFTCNSMGDLYGLDPAVRYVAAFQNWLKPAGASFDHLHKQLVAIDERPVQIEAEMERLRRNPKIYDEILSVAASRDLILAQNEHAVALAGIGHRFPTVAVWALGDPVNPWEASTEQVRAVSDLLHAVHAATGPDVPCNEEWYHRPASVSSPLRWRILVKWRISTLAGFEGGTRIYLNTIDPWGVRDRVLPKLTSLREQGLIAPMRLGKECKVDPSLLRG